MNPFAARDNGRARLDFDRDGHDWPNREASRFVEAGGLRWHVQIMGDGPPLLLLHGAGAATHSWRDLAPLLARRYQVIAPDLPGHGFTDPLPPGALSLPGMARAVGRLLDTLEIVPDVAVGHSAGAAVLARLALDRRVTLRRLIALNGAFLPFDGLAGHLLPPMAKLLFLNPFAPRFVAWTADRNAVERLLRGTGSRIDVRGVDLYARLFANAAHVAGTLGMMAHWDLDSLAASLPRLTAPLKLIAAGNDRTVPPESAHRVKALIPAAWIVRMEGVGHLAHEEKPDAVCDLIFEVLNDAQASC